VLAGGVKACEGGVSWTAGNDVEVTSPRMQDMSTGVRSGGSRERSWRERTGGLDGQMAMKGVNLETRGRREVYVCRIQLLVPGCVASQERCSGTVEVQCPFSAGEQSGKWRVKSQGNPTIKDSGRRSHLTLGSMPAK
jgi:hypothetical protein